MRFNGKLKTWNGDRGFGFITPTEGGQDIFVHVAELPRGRAPIEGDLLSFEVALNAEGKKKAINVRGIGCDGRKYCSQMTSCAEATYFLKNCPGVKMDGNRDGVPCEQQWCR